MITNDEYMELFGRFANALVLDRKQVQHWYRKLQEIDISTITYRF